MGFWVPLQWGEGKDGLDARSLMEELVRLYYSGLASWIWT